MLGIIRMLCKHNRLKRGQAAIEFMILIGVTFFTFLIFIGVFLYHTQNLNRQEEIKSLDDIATQVQNELSLASSVKDGYSRDFSLPQTIGGKDYAIIQEENYVYFETDKQSVSKSIPKISGSIHTGVNTITKSEGVVNVS